MVKILVIGDSCIDKFIYCHIDRICPEAPVPVLQPGYEFSNPGMAGNVAANLKALGVRVNLITNEEVITKIRYVDDKSGQMIMRLDENDTCERYDGVYETEGYDAIIISDYNKGFLTEVDIRIFAERAKCPVFLDTKKKLGEWCKNIDFIKINKPEWNNNYADYKGDNVIVTDGKNGAKYKGKKYPVETEVKVSNVAGAGDTFLAGLVFKYIGEYDIDNAIYWGNQYASKVVQERGVTTI